MSVANTVNEAGKGFYAAWRLLHCDAAAVSLLDDSRDGAVKSFWCAAIILPVYASLLLLETGTASQAPGNFGNLIANAGLFAAMLTKLSVFVLTWVVWPLAMHRLAPYFGRDENFFRYLTAYNWAHGVRIGILACYMLVRYLGLIPDDLLLGYQVAVLVILWAYHWFLLREVLDVDGLTAASLVAAESALLMMIGLMALSVAA